MASPFRIFRKNQKMMMVVACVIAIFVFVLGDSLVSYVTGSRNARAGDDRDARAVAVHWDGGQLTNRQLNQLVVQRQILNGFLKEVQRQGEQSAQLAGVDPPPLRVQQLLGAETLQQGVERSVVQTKLFADAARDAGMKVSDDTAGQYLDELGRGNVSRERMRTILGGMQRGAGRASIEFVMDALREEMLARNYVSSQQFTFETVTPQQRWKDWLRVNDRVVIEAAAVPAESFLVDVKDPTEAELTAYFDKYKDREAGPELAYGTTELPSPTPGFKVPRKIDLQFVQASYDEFVAKAEEKVTDDEIAKYYDEHKKLFEKADTGLMEDTGRKKDGQKSESPAIKSGTKDEAKPQDTEKKPGEPDAKKAAAPGDATESKAAPSQDKKTEGQPPADSTKSQPESKDGKGESGAPDGKKSSDQSNPARSAFRLTAFEQDAKKKDADADKAGTPPDSKTERAPDKPVATSDAKAGTGADKPAAASSPESSESKAAGSADKPAAAPAAGSPAAPAGTAPPANKKPVEYQPLAEVKDLIRRQLAEGKVAEQLTKLTTQIQSQLETEFDNWFNEALAAQADKQEPPAPAKSLNDLVAIAQKNGLKHVRTGSKSLLELREMPIGKSSVSDTGQGLLSMLFAGHELDLYQPKSTVDFDGNRYVVMKMSDTPARVPTLAEVKDDVVRAWKKEKSAELAQKQAEALAKKAQEAKSPLTTFFAEDKAVKVVRTDPFSELTGGDVGLVNGQFQQQPYRLGQPNEIVAPGPDFMKRVFELKEGEVGVALNHDHSIAYVVRVVEHQPALPELRTAYLAEANSWPGFDHMTQGHVQEVASNLSSDIIVGSHLTWDRPADKSAKDEQHDEG